MRTRTYLAGDVLGLVGKIKRDLDLISPLAAIAQPQLRPLRAPLCR